MRYDIITTYNRLSYNILTLYFSVDYELGHTIYMLQKINVHDYSQFIRALVHNEFIDFSSVVNIISSIQHLNKWLKLREHPRSDMKQTLKQATKNLKSLAKQLSNITSNNVIVKFVNSDTNEETIFNSKVRKI